MSATISSLDSVLEQRGRSTRIDAPVVACAFDATGARAAWAMGDGTLRLLRTEAAAEAGDQAWHAVPMHDGAVLALAEDATGGFLTGGDDGEFARLDADGGKTVIARHGSRWVEHVACFADGRARVLACAVGRKLHLFDAQGLALKALEHPSSVTGIAFDPKGKRVAASHYGGASLWFVGSKSDNPRRLEWKGSHTGIAFSPDNDHVVTAMQENALHGWRLSDGEHMRMSGYPAKTESLGFTRGGKWLASAGADSVVLWPFFGGGPMGKAPTELAPGMQGAMCMRVACHPRQELVAAGYSDGVVLIVDIGSRRVLPVCGPGPAPGRGAVTGLAWSSDGARLAFGTEGGTLGLIDLSRA